MDTRRLSVDPSKIMNSLSHAVKYKHSMWVELKKISSLVKSGHKIQWSTNERWCSVNGETFNVAKTVYEKRVLESELEDVFTDYYWDDRSIQIWCDFNGVGGETVFDFSVQEMDLQALDEYLSGIFNKN